MTRRLDFCIYTPNEEDYWGQFEKSSDLFSFLETAVPGFKAHSAYDPKNSGKSTTHYRVNDTLIVVIGV